MISRPLIAKGCRFLFTGTIGFVTDAGALWLGTTKFQLDPYTARLISFTFALTVTWFLNRHFTFKTSTGNGKRQFGNYAVVQITSFGLNYIIYSGLVWIDFASPLKALAISAIISMIYSFTAMNLWVFRPNQS
ncbi:GtrA family protein [Thalassospira alkalitolerans]|uniref:GtrA family protein n=1 Tax=Thalassospira alkalitolerans TaxID=1293890 RepID=UPI0030EDE9F9|tara:strand:+ start:28592 stop:28990 length:399 start_codon:yes stop_codon:yes gene_type:complete